MKKTAGRRSFYAFFCLRAGGWVLRRPGGEQVLRLRARDGAFRAPARVTFFFCKKKVTKENHLDLRFKDPLARGGFRRPGGEQVLRLRAQARAFRAPARVPFFFCKKKGTKENHLDLRSKDPLARYELCKIGGADLAELVRRVSLSVRGIACTSCAAAADSSEGRGWCADRMAIIKSRPLRREAPQWVGGS